MRILLLFVILFGSVKAFSQNVEIRGKVVNSETGKALPYSHLLMLDKSMGTSANEDGMFAFSVPPEFEESRIRISHVGFEARIMTISQLAGKTIELNPLKQGLGEVYLVNILEDKKFVYRPDWKRKSIGFGNLNGGLYPSQVARYYEKPDKFKEECFIKEIELYFLEVKEQFGLSPKFRLHIYSVGENGEPGEELGGDIVLEKKPATDRLKLGLLEEKIRIPENGFFVGVEHLFISENRFVERKDYYVNDSLVAKNYAQTKFAPIFKGEIAPENEMNTWYYSPSGWKKITEFDLRHEVFDDGIPVPVFKIKLTD